VNNENLNELLEKCQNALNNLLNTYSSVQNRLAYTSSAIMHRNFDQDEQNDARFNYTWEYLGNLTRVLNATRESLGLCINQTETEFTTLESELNATRTLALTNREDLETLYPIVERCWNKTLALNTTLTEVVSMYNQNFLRVNEAFRLLWNTTQGIEGTVEELNLTMTTFDERLGDCENRTGENEALIGNLTASIESLEATNRVFSVALRTQEGKTQAVNKSLADMAVVYNRNFERVNQAFSVLINQTKMLEQRLDRRIDSVNGSLTLLGENVQEGFAVFNSRTTENKGRIDALANEVTSLQRQNEALRQLLATEQKRTEALRANLESLSYVFVAGLSAALVGIIALRTTFKKGNSKG